MPASPARREPLDRDRVLRAAVQLADAEGLAAVSMRRLAQQLGVVPMALYKHVADKEALLDGMVDVVVGEFGTPAPGPAAQWQDAVRGRVLSARRAVAHHPWARAALGSRTRRTPAVLGHLEAVAGGFLAGGLSPDLTHHLLHALGDRVWGLGPEPFDAAPVAPLAADFAWRFPAVLAVTLAATGVAPGGGCDEDAEFAFALDLLLDGAERLHRAGRRPGS